MDELKVNEIEQAINDLLKAENYTKPVSKIPSKRQARSKIKLEVESNSMKRSKTQESYPKGLPRGRLAQDD